MANEILFCYLQVGVPLSVTCMCRSVTKRGLIHHIHGYYKVWIFISLLIIFPEPIDSLAHDTIEPMLGSVCPRSFQVFSAPALVSSMSFLRFPYHHYITYTPLLTVTPGLKNRPVVSYYFVISKNFDFAFSCLNTQHLYVHNAQNKGLC